MSSCPATIERSVRVERQHLYVGTRDSKNRGRVFAVNEDCDYEIPLREELIDYGTVTPDWGYAGKGPAQLALALLAHVAGDEAAMEYHGEFKEDVIAGLDHAYWTLDEERIEAWLTARMMKGVQSL